MLFPVTAFPSGALTVHDVCAFQMNKAPVKLNLLTSQLKLVPEDKKQFDLVSRELLVDKSMSQKSFCASTQDTICFLPQPVC